MNNNDERQILNLLYGVVNLNNYTSLSSLAEKRNYLNTFLRNNISFMSLSTNIDVDSDEVQQLITDNFLFHTPTIKCFECEGYTPWLDAVRPSINWKFYDRYESYLLHYKNWEWETVCQIRMSTDVILDHMANPNSGLNFNKKGLVIGDIQSGKTANYTGLINKAFDVGYKIVIILAGLTKDLRNQTQIRIDREVLGYETKYGQKGLTIGVGNVSHLSINGLTYADNAKDYGEFRKYFTTHTLDNSVTPLVAIVKKNKSVLENVAEFLKSSPEYCYTNGKLDIPVLIIDDEVDQASVDTKNSMELEKASAINKAIREILDKLNRYAYVGYTATPFANVFINPDNENDLYPRDFILCLERPRNYCGVKEYFGIDIRDEEDTNDLTAYYENDLFRNITDFDDFFGNQENNSQVQSINLPLSLKNAIRSFILASSIKKQRGIIEHNSMLIHISSYKAPATSLKPLVVQYLNSLYLDLKYNYDEEISIYKEFWEVEFKNTSINRLGNDYKDNWEDIEKVLLDTISSASLDIKVVNGDLNEQVDYDSSKSGEHIIIGGNKLSRGLTLDGLIVSYYYRKSKLYDSLLQMGRWFGFRAGWLDLCRIYTSIDILNNFIYAGRALERFKNDVNEMLIERKNPREVGQKIMYSPRLLPTSRSKMKHSSMAKVSFSQEVQQVISFAKKYIKYNFDLTENFIKSLGYGEIRDKHKVVFKHVSVDKILNYLRNFKDADEYKGQIFICNWINYIETVLEYGELQDWTVVLSSVDCEDPERKLKIGDYTIYKSIRTLRDCGDSTNLETLLLKANTDPLDFREIFDPESEPYRTVKSYKPSNEYPEFNSNTGLMSIYIGDFYEKIEDGQKENSKGVLVPHYRKGERAKDAVNVVGPAIWFPKTNDIEKSAVKFFVNEDYKKHMFEDKCEEGDDIND